MLSVAPSAAVAAKFTLAGFSANQAGALELSAGSAKTFKLTARDVYSNIVPTNAVPTLAKSLQFQSGSLSDGAALGVDCATFGGRSTANVQCCRLEANRLQARYRSPGCFESALRVAYGMHCGASGGGATGPSSTTTNLGLISKLLRRLE